MDTFASQHDALGSWEEQEEFLQGLNKALKDKYGEGAPSVSERLATCGEVILTLEEDTTCQDIELYFTDGAPGGSDTGG